VDLEDLRLAVYRSFARTGRPPHADDLAERLALDVTTVRAGLAELARARQIVLDQAGQIVMAHPFSAVPLGFAVMGRQTLWWAAALGTPSHCRRCSRTRTRSSCPPDAQPAPIRTPGT
jgi:hypothetical protein